MDSLIFTDEASIAGVPVPFLTINSVAPTIMAFGTDEQKKFFLPRSRRANCTFPSLLGARRRHRPGQLRTTAVHDGDDYVINGQKMWTSLIAYADWVWLAVRTNPEAKKHRGISMLVVPTTARASPGRRCTPWPAWTPAQPTTLTCASGDEPGRRGERRLEAGDQPAQHERVALVSAQPIFLALREVREWAQTPRTPVGPAHRSEWVQINLARVHAKAEVLKLINWSWPRRKMTTGARGCVSGKCTGPSWPPRLPAADGGAGYRSDGAAGSPGALLRGRVERMHRACLILTFGGAPTSAARHHRHGRTRTTPQPLSGSLLFKGRTFMDFTTTEAAQDLGGLVDTIVDSVCTPEHQRELDGLDQRFDRKLWSKLVDSDILTSASASALGGDNFGALEQVAILVALGHQLAAVPYLESVMLGAGRWPVRLRRAPTGWAHGC